jgi:heptosyltransferase-1
LHTQSKFRLLVVRLGAMGDILHALPAVTALRMAHPEWIIDWVIEPKWRALLSARPDTSLAAGRGIPVQPVVDTLHFAATKEWRSSPLASQTRGEIGSLRRSLKAGEYDTVLDLQGAVRSSIISRMAGSQRVIGEAEPRERAARLFFNDRVATHGAHVIEQDLELAAAVAGDELTALQPWLPVDPVAEKWAEELLRSSPEQPSALINPGAGWGAKRWPVERYAAVAQGLVERGLRVLINGGPGEEPLLETIAHQATNAVTLLTGNLDQLIAVTRRVAMVIAGDTGPLHLACALGRPVVGIYGPTDPRRNGPFGTRFKVLRSPESRRDHTRHEAPEAGLLTITPEQVLRAAEELLYPEAAQ